MMFRHFKNLIHIIMEKIMKKLIFSDLVFNYKQQDIQKSLNIIRIPLYQGLLHMSRFSLNVVVFSYL